MLRTREVALQHIQALKSLRTEHDKVEMRKGFGVKEDDNPLLYIPADLFK